MSANLVQFLNQYSFEYVIKATGEKIHFKPMTTGQLKKLLTFEGSDDINEIEKILDDLIVGCVTTEGFNSDSLTVQDRFDLMIELRKKSRGEVYQFIIRCPKCKAETINNVNLDELNVKPFPKDIDCMIELSPDLSVEVGHLTRGQQSEAFEFVSSMKDESEAKQMVEMTSYMYALSMKKFKTPAGDIDDVPIEEKVQLLNSLESSKYDLFGEWFVKNDYGTEFKYELKCNNCDFKESREIPVTDFFA